MDEGPQDVSVTAQIGKSPMQSVKEKEYHKTTLHNKPHIGDCWEGNPRRCLPQLGQKATENWAENQFLQSWGGSTLSKVAWDWMAYGA